jgi:predicted RNA-binding Zn ribbon-like protein
MVIGSLTAKIYFAGYNTGVSETNPPGSGALQQGAAASRAPDPLCIRFINTLDWRNDPQCQVEQLSSYPELVKWARKEGLSSEVQANVLLGAAARRRRQAELALKRALDFREVLYRLFSAVAARRDPPREDVGRLNAVHAQAAVNMRISCEKQGRYAWAWAGEDEDLDRILWPVARSAAELLTEGPLDRLRECERGGCGWMFVDKTRNRSRRWCAMKVCGNRSKVERYYRRHRKEK